MERWLVNNISRLQSGRVGLYETVARFVFFTSVATLLNDEAAEVEKLYEAFLCFDKQLPIAAAGISVDYFSNAKKGRALMLQTIKAFRENTSEFFKQRWAYFEKAGVPTDDTAAFNLAILWASVGNSMPIMFWVLFYLLQNSACMDKLRQEIKTVVGDSAASSGTPLDLSQEQLTALYYMDACITEALRLSSGSLLMRFVRNPCELTLASGNTYRFRKGDRVGIVPPLMHLDEEIFSTADAFQPERWMVAGASDAEKALAVTGKKPHMKGGKVIEG